MLNGNQQRRKKLKELAVGAVVAVEFLNWPTAVVILHRKSCSK